ncbi:unnamed protein product, partial [marine sediment metagenome]
MSYKLYHYANTATKIVFRLPYDSQTGGKFLSLNEEQETYLRNMKRGRALVSIPNSETFEIATKPFVDKFILDHKETKHELEDETFPEMEPVLVQDTISNKEDENKPKEKQIPETEAQTVVFDRVGRFGNHVVAFLASAEMSTEQEIR